MSVIPLKKIAPLVVIWRVPYSVHRFLTLYIFFHNKKNNPYLKIKQSTNRCHIGLIEHSQFGLVFCTIQPRAKVPLNNSISICSFEQNLSKYLRFFRGRPVLKDVEAKKKTKNQTCRNVPFDWEKVVLAKFKE